MNMLLNEFPPMNADEYRDGTNDGIANCLEKLVKMQQNFIGQSENMSVEAIELFTEQMVLLAEMPVVFSKIFKTVVEQTFPFFGTDEQKAQWALLFIKELSK